MENHPKSFGGNSNIYHEIKEYRREQLASVVNGMDITPEEKARRMRCIGVDFVMFQNTGIIVEVLPETATGQKP